MIVTCGSCEKKYKLTEEHFKGKDRISIKCPNCGTHLQVVREAEPQEPAPPPTTATHHRPESTSMGGDVPDQESLAMPEGKRVSLAILQGKDAGRIFHLEKTVVVLGRTGADVVLDDTEVSRRHAQIEMKGPQIVLRDLKSTNGTYVNEQRVTLLPIENQCEFRVGTTTIMLILTDVES